MGELNNVFKKLNIMEQAQLNRYINREINTQLVIYKLENDKRIEKAQDELNKRASELQKYYYDTNNETWDRLNISIHTALRENHVSENRIEKIDERIKELNKQEELLLGEDIKSEYKILQDADWQKLIELLMYCNCRNCNDRNHKCGVYPLLKKYKVPYSGESFKCKYSYKGVI